MIRNKRWRWLQGRKRAEKLMMLPWFRKWERGKLIMTHTRSVCSCHLCNYGRKFRGPTKQELLNQDEFEEQLDDIM